MEFADDVRKLAATHIYVLGTVVGLGEDEARQQIHGLADRLRSEVPLGGYDHEVGDPEKVDGDAVRVAAYLGSTESRPRAAMEAVIAKTGKTGWSAPEPRMIGGVPHSDYLTAEWRAGPDSEPGTVQLQVHAATGMAFVQAER